MEGSSSNSMQLVPAASSPSVALRLVTWSKVLLVGALIAGAGILAGITFVENMSSQQRAFVNAYNIQSDKLAAQLASALGLKIQTAQVVASLFVNGTAPSFAAFLQTGLQAINLTNTQAVVYGPIVPFAQRAAFESLAVADAASLAFLNDPLIAAAAAGGIWQADFSSATDGPHPATAAPYYIPIRFIAPVAGAESGLLFDIRYVPTPGVFRVLNDGLPGTSQIIESGLANDPTATRPFSFAYIPVWAASYPNGTRGALAGLLWVQFFWDSLLSTGVAQALTGLDVSLQQYDGAAHSFSVVDSGVVNRGQGLRNDPGMNAYERDVTVTVGLAWRFRIYPSLAFYNAQFDSTPRDGLISTIAVVAAVCAAFLLYDYAASRARAALAAVAETQARVVADVLPGAVRARVLVHLADTAARAADKATRAGGRRDGTDSGGRGVTGGSWAVGIRPPGRSSIDGGKASGDRGAATLSESVSASIVTRSVSLESPSPVAEEETPETAAVGWAASRVDALREIAAGLHHDGHHIADYYLSCTVFFSDIVNFTSWAAANPPARVFSVLEVMFALFDELAKKHAVFKPSELHAVSIADFALDVQLAMEVVRESTGVPDLAIRIGLHSGPLTAGVIRAKANHRFQLFGDTMNHGSRMESTGEPNRIQISGATHDLLAAAGTHVLAPRGTIAVKGKGNLDTHWLVGLSPARFAGAASGGESTGGSANVDDSDAYLATGRHASLPPGTRVRGSGGGLCGLFGCGAAAEPAIVGGERRTTDSSPPPAPPPAPTESESEPAVLPPPASPVAAPLPRLLSVPPLPSGEDAASVSQLPPLSPMSLRGADTRRLVVGQSKLMRRNSVGGAGAPAGPAPLPPAMAAAAAAANATAAAVAAELREKALRREPASPEPGP